MKRQGAGEQEKMLSATGAMTPNHQRVNGLALLKEVPRFVWKPLVAFFFHSLSDLELGSARLLRSPQLQVLESRVRSQARHAQGHLNRRICYLEIVSA